MGKVRWAKRLLTRARQLRTFGAKGTWALITGASDGIGKEFASQLARAGYNVLLVSRTESKLQALAAEITASHADVRAETLAMDFAADAPRDYERLKAAIEGKEISILVNNVGKSHDMPVPFVQTPLAEMEDIITVNCLATLRVTHLVLPGMISARKGLILTMGSFGGLTPTPLLATYSGSKAFLQQWSSALGAEVAKYGIRTELVQSYLVTSNMSKIKRSNLLTPTPKAFVKSTLAKIGRSGGTQGWAYTTSPYWSHGLVAWALTSFVGVMNHALLRTNLRMHEDIRARALRAAERRKHKKAT